MASTGTITITWDDEQDSYAITCSNCDQRIYIPYAEFSMSLIAKHLEE